MFTSLRTQFSSQDRLEPLPPTTSHHILGDVGVVLRDPYDTLQTPHLDGNGETDHPLAVGVAINPTASSSRPADTQSPSHMVAHIQELQIIPQILNNAGSEGFLDVGAMPSPMPSLTSPRHVRPLYHSIKLPGLDDDEPKFGPQEIMLSPAGSPIPALGSSPPARTAMSPPVDEPTVLDFPLQINALGLYTNTPCLHDIVRRALFDPSFSLQPLEPSVARQLWDPAAGSDIRALSILLLESGTTINVKPSIRNGGDVCVGDVLRALEASPAGSDARNGTRGGVTVKGYY